MHQRDVRDVQNVIMLISHFFKAKVTKKKLISQGEIPFPFCYTAHRFIEIVKFLRKAC